MSITTRIVPWCFRENTEPEPPARGKERESCDMKACAWSFMGPNALPRLLLTFKPIVLADATVAPAHQCCGVSIQASLKNAIFVDSFKRALGSPLQALARLCTFLLTRRGRHQRSCWADALLGSVTSVTPRPLSFTLLSLQYSQTQQPRRRWARCLTGLRLWSMLAPVARTQST